MGKLSVSGKFFERFMRSPTNRESQYMRKTACMIPGYYGIISGTYNHIAQSDQINKYGLWESVTRSMPDEMVKGR